jgi:hypothetical protein
MARSHEELIAWKNDGYAPVEGCEECEFAETACYECFLYGEAKPITSTASCEEN